MTEDPSPPTPFTGPEPAVVPFGRVRRRHTALHLRAERELVVGSTDVCGELIEIEVVWEPLGWVVEDWIDTIAVAPSEHSALSDTDIAGSALTVDEASDRLNTRIDSGERTGASTRDVMRLATNVLTSGRSVKAGLNADRGPTGVDPVASLAQAVTGTLQLGYSTATTSGKGRYSGEIRNELETAIQRVTTQLRSSESRIMSDAAGRLVDHRRLRVIRNPSTAQALNLAVFSLARQWRVTTKESRRARVVFVPVEELRKPFTVEEVFRYRTVLSGVLLDPELGDALENSARSYRRPPGGRPRQLDHIECRIAFSDAPMRGSYVSVTLEAHRAQESVYRINARVPPARPGEVRRFRIGSRGYREAEITGVVLTMHANANGFDRRAEVSDLQLFAVYDDETRHPVLDLEERFELLAGSEQVVPLRWQTAGPVDPEAELARLLDHLDTYRHYYRLAIDLQRDAVSRFVALRERSSDGQVLPTDMNPVGIAGAHIAFLCADRVDETDQADQTDEADRTGRTDGPEPQGMMVTTPTDGVLVEAVPSAGKAVVDSETWRPTELPTSDSRFAWPPPVGVVQPSTGAPGAVPVPATPVALSEPPDVAGTPDSAPLTRADLPGLVETIVATMSAMSTGDAVNGRAAAAGAAEATGGGGPSNGAGRKDEPGQGTGPGTGNRSV